MKSLLTLLALLLTNLLSAQWVQKGIDIDGEAAGDFSGWSVSMPDASTLAIGAITNDGNGNNSGHVRIYEWNSNAWVQKGNDIDGEAATDESGQSISMPNSNTIAIGAPFNDGFGIDGGHVRIFQWSGSAWVQKGSDIDGWGTGNRSGYSVSMPDPNTVAIGAPLNNTGGSNAGHVRVYEWSGTAWSIKGSAMVGESPGDESGHSVSMPDANTVAIGAYANGNSGHVRIYEWNGFFWLPKGNDIDGEASGDQSGWSVSMPNANTVAIGARFNDGNGMSAGHVRIYEWSGTAWVQKGNDIDGEAIDDRCGFSVSMPSANTVAIGAHLNDGSGTDAGHVRVYRWNGMAWIQVGSDIDGEAAIDASGTSVSMPDANTVAIGAPFNNSSGHVRVYRLSSITSLAENDLNTKLTLYPNPSAGELSIELADIISHSLQILDLSGKVIQEFPISKARTNLDLSGLAEGIYFVKYGELTKKLVITR